MYKQIIMFNYITILQFINCVSSSGTHFILLSDIIKYLSFFNCDSLGDTDAIFTHYHL